MPRTRNTSKPTGKTANREAAIRGTTQDEAPKVKAQTVLGSQKGDFIAPPERTEVDERSDALPQQEEFWRPPVRFGGVTVEKDAVGWDGSAGFRELFPQVMLPLQVVEPIGFGTP